ncbi:universal stress protein UspB [Vibrio viridaestus]|uniref:Universal stress protein B n=1 Tax=Vibrio viridaestus TaxID=2487322 RepID=A0A3N9TD42_9VIBR|nr:universal stress protein UspB [Vibrio viridaestus]RQW61435.1 universal stress protein UspB [Vibrio viridaestus]
MISGDTILFVLMLITLVNIARGLTALRTLIYIMREAHPLLYQQVDGPGFFKVHANVAKQVRLYHYLKSREYANHHDETFIYKCEKVRQLTVLSCALVVVTMFAGILL